MALLEPRLEVGFLVFKDPTEGFCMFAFDGSVPLVHFREPQTSENVVRALCKRSLLRQSFQIPNRVYQAELSCTKLLQRQSGLLCMLFLSYESVERIAAYFSEPFGYFCAVILGSRTDSFELLENIGLTIAGETTASAIATNSLSMMHSPEAKYHVDCDLFAQACHLRL